MLLLATETKFTSYINLFMTGYNIIRADHPRNWRRGRLPILVKNSIKNEVLPGFIE